MPLTQNWRNIPGGILGLDYQGNVQVMSRKMLVNNTLEILGYSPGMGSQSTIRFDDPLEEEIGELQMSDDFSHDRYVGLYLRDGGVMGGTLRQILRIMTGNPSEYFWEFSRDGTGWISFVGAGDVLNVNAESGSSNALTATPTSGIVKIRLRAVANRLSLACNLGVTTGGTVFQDDTGKSSWNIILAGDTDTASINHYPAGSTTATEMMKLDGSTGQLSVSGYKVPYVRTSTSAPSDTPAYVGMIHINTTAKTVYIARGTSSSTDWGSAL